jgi:hypothetical protein
MRELFILLVFIIASVLTYQCGLVAGNARGVSDTMFAWRMNDVRFAQSVQQDGYLKTMCPNFEFNSKGSTSYDRSKPKKVARRP